MNSESELVIDPSVYRWREEYIKQGGNKKQPLSSAGPI